MVGVVDSCGQGYILWQDNFFLLVKSVLLLTENVSVIKSVFFKSINHFINKFTLYSWTGPWIHHVASACLGWPVYQ